MAVKVHKIVFDRAITTRDLQEQLAVSVGLNRLANVILKAKGDTIITISPTMIGNNSRSVVSHSAWFRLRSCQGS